MAYGSLPECCFEYMKSNGEVMITRLKNKKMTGAVVIPSRIDCLPVTRIRGEAFAGCRGLTIHTPARSYVEKYAKDNGINCVNDYAWNC